MLKVGGQRTKLNSYIKTCKGLINIRKFKLACNQNNANKK